MGDDEHTPPFRKRDDRRRLIGGAAAVLLLTLPTMASGNSRPPTVLFICQFGSVRSAVTRELFRRRAQERGLRVKAISRGITPEPHLAPQLRVQLAADAIDPDRDGLLRLEKSDLTAADMIVFFDPLPAGWRGGDLRDWTDIGSFNDHYIPERARVMARIDGLLDEIAAQQRR